MQSSRARIESPLTRNEVGEMRELLHNVGTRVFTVPLGDFGFREAMRIAVSLVDSDGNNNANNNNNSSANTSRGRAPQQQGQQQQQQQQTSRSGVWSLDESTTRTARRERRRKKRACDHDDKSFCSKCHTRRRHDYRWFGRPYYKLN